MSSSSGVHGPAHPGQDATPVETQLGCEVHQRGNLAVLGQRQPGFPRETALPSRKGPPQALELFGHHVLVGLEHFVQLNSLTFAQVRGVAKQQPVGLFDHAPRGPVVTQPVGRVHPHPADHLPAVLGHHVK